MTASFGLLPRDGKDCSGYNHRCRMPYKDAERKRAHYREYMRKRRSEQKGKVVPNVVPKFQSKVVPNVTPKPLLVSQGVREVPPKKIINKLSLSFPKVSCPKPTPKPIPTRILPITRIPSPMVGRCALNQSHLLTKDDLRFPLPQRAGTFLCRTCRESGV